MKKQSKQFLSFMMVVTLAVGLCSGCGSLSKEDAVEPIITEEESDLGIAYNNIYPNAPEVQVVPVTEGDGQDFFEVNDLPALVRMSKEDQEEKTSQLQVYQRMQVLGVSSENFKTPEQNWKNIYNYVYANQSAEIEQILLCASEEPEIDKAILLDRVSNVSVENITVDGGCTYGLYVVESDHFTIDNCELQGASMQGLVLMGNIHTFAISASNVSDNGYGGIYMDGNVHYGVVENTKVLNNSGTQNLTAGITLSSINIVDYETTANAWYDELLTDKIEVPNCMVFYQNAVAGNNSSGIYSDGGYCNYFIENELRNNDKEGMCLDYGSFGNYLSENIIEGNGGRLRQTDADLEMDYVISYGRMEDGSSKAKLPGVSLDNTAYNILLKNVVRDNYGSGIKTVRSAYRNVIMENSVMDNNVGVNDDFHFFGIELGFADEPDTQTIGMDFTPDYENVVCNNMIVGEHYAGIFLQEGTYGNDIYNNCVVSQGDWALEDHSKTTNNIHDNVTIGENLTVADDE